MLRIIVFVGFGIAYVYFFVQMVRGYMNELSHPGDEAAEAMRWDNFAWNGIFGIAVVCAGQPLATPHWVWFALNTFVGWALTNGWFMLQNLDIKPFIIWKVFCTTLLWTSGLAIHRFYPVILFVGLVAYVLVQYREVLTKNQKIGTAIVAAVILAIWKVPGLFLIGKILVLLALLFGCIVCFLPSDKLGKAITLVVGIICGRLLYGSILALIAMIVG